MKNIFAEMTS